MIELLLKVIDRLITLASIREKRAKARFDEIYKPSFQELQSVHTDYMEMLSDISSRLAKIKASTATIDPEGIALLEFIKSRREVMLIVRDKLRELHYLVHGSPMGASKLDLPEEEMQFLSSVSDYFFGSGLTSNAREPSFSCTLIEMLEIALERGTPRLEDVRSSCDSVRTMQQQAWKQAVRSFNSLRLYSAHRTT